MEADEEERENKKSLKGIEIRVMTTPDMKGEKPAILTEIAVMKNGIIVKEISTKNMDEKEFNKALYELQDEYGIKKCEVKRTKISNKSRQI